MEHHALTMTLFPTPRSSCRCRGGFTLMELLMVMVIASLLLGLVAPVANQVIQSNRLGSAASNLANQINLARMTAVRLNKPVEVRFFSYADAQAPGSAAGYRAAQLWVGSAPFQPMTVFEDGVIIATGTAEASWSSLLNPTYNAGAGAEPPPDFKLARAVPGSAITVSTFQFQPDGSTNLGGSGHWSLTLAQESDLAGDALPPNFITLMVDPVNGSVRMLRPD